MRQACTTRRGATVAAQALIALAGALALSGPAQAQSEGDLRIIGEGDRPRAGQIEIYSNNEWGLVCDDWWDIKDARVACRQMGFSDARSATKKIRGSDHQRRYWLDDVQCDGTETTLASCPRRYNLAWGEHNCNPYTERAGVVCESLVGDEPGVDVYPRFVNVTENGDAASYAVTLMKQPSGTVTVTPATTSTAITLNTTSLTFTTTTWNVTQVVEITAVADSDYDEANATITHTVSGADYDGLEAASVDVTVRDPDDRAILARPDRIRVLEEDPDGATYEIRLKTAPTADVTVSVDVQAHATITASPTSLTFTTGAGMRGRRSR